MRKVLKILPLVAMLVLGACSSMEPKDDFERYGNLLPPDFDLAKFSELNPDIAASQAVDTVKLLNTAWENKRKESGSSPTQITNLKNQDKTAFFNGDGKIIAKNYLNWGDATIDSVVALAIKAPNFADTTAQGRLNRFNIYGESNTELAFLENFLKTQMDSSLVMKTYVLYSKKDGRPYRKCKPSELANEVKNINMEGVIDIQSGSRHTYDYSELLFCDDNGVVRKATDF